MLNLFSLKPERRQGYLLFTWRYNAVFKSLVDTIIPGEKIDNIFEKREKTFSRQYAKWNKTVIIVYLGNLKALVKRKTMELTQELVKVCRYKKNIQTSL